MMSQKAKGIIFLLVLTTSAVTLGQNECHNDYHIWENVKNCQAEVICEKLPHDYHDAQTIVNSAVEHFIIRNYNAIDPIRHLQLCLSVTNSYLMRHSGL
jgi:hypothetical protein